MSIDLESEPCTAQSVGLPWALLSVSRNQVNVLHARKRRTLTPPIRRHETGHETHVLRILGVPRSAAGPISREVGIGATEPLHRLRSSLRELDERQWPAALGASGPTYRFAWSIIEEEI